MSSDVVIHGFETSNNIKVRVALGYKDIPYRFQAIDPADRAEIQRLSGQSLTPVMVHGDRVLFDSAAIIRYLEANFRGRPSLFGAGRIEQWKVEELELFGRHTLAMPMMEVVHHKVGGGTVDAAMQARCARDYAEAVETIARTLAERQWLVGESMSIADITAAAVMYRVRQAKPFDPPAATPRLQEWEDRVLAYDRHLKRS